MFVDFVVLANDEELLLQAGMQLSDIPRKGEDFVLDLGESSALFIVADVCWECVRVIEGSGFTIKAVIRLVQMKVLKSAPKEIKPTEEELRLNEEIEYGLSYEEEKVETLRARHSEFCALNKGGTVCNCEKGLTVNDD